MDLVEDVPEAVEMADAMPPVEEVRRVTWRAASPTRLN
jgi:hypothetical protein